MRDQKSVLTEENLHTLRLSELWAKYAEIVGEPSRCPNKSFLIRRIMESVEENAAEAPTDSLKLAVEPQEQVAEVIGLVMPESEEGTESIEEVANDSATTAEDNVEEPVFFVPTLGLAVTPELEEDQTIVEAETLDNIEAEIDAGEASAKNDPWPMGEEEAVFEVEIEQQSPEAAEGTVEFEIKIEPGAVQRPQVALRDLTIEELQREHRRVLERPTRSENRAYLTNRIRRGKSERRTEEDFKVLPVRLPVESIEYIDRIWRRHGLKSRMDFFRQAIGAYLSASGEESEIGEFKFSGPLE